MKKINLLISVFAVLVLCGCGNNSQNNNKNTSNIVITEEPEEEYIPQVFVMAGQSNMEGNSYYDNGKDWLRKTFENEGWDDVDRVFDGMSEVMTSYYGTGYGELDQEDQIHASNKENKIEGKFLPTKVGMGHTDDMFGPELGAAYVISQYASEDKPVYFIKCASGGSGFAQSGTKYNWDVSKEGNLYEARFKPYVENNLRLIEEETGLKPVIRGFMWHQGESDSDESKIPLYRDRVDNLLTTFKEDFTEYAKDEDTNNIAFIDCTLTEQSGASSTNKAMNEVKQSYSEESDMNFLIDGNDLGLKITTNGWGDTNGSNGSLHYTCESEFKLGMAYGNVIIENGLLE